MRRLLIYTLVFPLIALAVFMAPEVVSSPTFPPFSLILTLIGFAYVITIVPALLSAGADWAMSRYPSYIRVVGTAVAAAVLTWLTSQFLGALEAHHTVLMMGAVPAAVCSWLSGKGAR